MNLFNLLNSSVSFSQKATDGLITFVIGMAVVFIGMEILVLCVEGFGKLAAYIANKTEKKPEEKAESKNENVSEDGVSARAYQTTFQRRRLSR